MPRLRKSLGLAVVACTAGIVLHSTAAGVRLEEDLALRSLFAVRGPLEPPRGVVVVSIDRASADQLRTVNPEWPPSRHVHARVIRSLTSFGVSAVVIDVFFRDRRSAAEDDDLAEAIAKSGRVILFESVNRLKYPGGDILEMRSPIGRLRDAALATAPFPLPEGPVVNFFWTFAEASGGRVPTLPAVALHVHALPHQESFLALLRRAGVGGLSELPARPGTAPASRQYMQVIRRELERRPSAVRDALRALDRRDGPTATRNDVLAALVRMYAGRDAQYLNFYGPPGRIRTIPLHELLANGPALADAFKEAVVFVGEGASGPLRSADQRDTYRTVYSEDGVDLSGVEVAATAFANLLENRTLRPVSRLAEVGTLVVVGVVASLLARAFPGLYAAAAIVGLAVAHYALAQYLFTRQALLVPVAVPLLIQGPLALFGGVLLRYRDVRKQVAREVEPGAPADVMEGVCLATDIENYAAASAGMVPGDLALLMNDYYDTVTRVVTARRGLMMGRAGDSAMCVWEGFRPDTWRARVFDRRGGGRHEADRRARTLACQAAIDLGETISRFNARHATPLRTRIGLHAGQIAMGAVGGEYHVIGDVPNTASRIEGLNKHLGTNMLASEPVIRGQDTLCLRPLGRFILAGTPGQLEIVEIVGRVDAVDPATRELCERFARALNAYLAGDVASAGALFQAITVDHPSDGPARYYHRVCSDRAAGWAGGPPPAFRMDAK
jgi:adenylate cyclase